MPVMHFHLRWPDGHEERCYSPSLVVRDHLQAGSSYALPDFLERVRTALHTASDRVHARYGHACTAALSQLAAIESRAAACAAHDRVQVVAFDPAAP